MSAAPQKQSDRRRIFLSNGFTGAIVLDGSIDWFPCPKFDSPSIFSKILDDRTGGYFSIKPELPYKIRTSYIEDTLVARNEFSTSKGVLNVTDFLPIGNTGIIRIYESKVPFIADISPLFGYGMINPGVEQTDGGLIFRNRGSEEGLEVRIDGKYGMVEDSTVRVEPGKGSIFALYSKDLRYGLFSNKGFVYPEPYDTFHKTVRYWRDQLSVARRVKKYEHAYKRSIETVLGLIYLPSGAVIAAPTTSLPEIVGKGRNWDYRYMWVRDASYAAEALANSGYILKSKRIIDFMLSVLDPSSKSFNHPLYSIDGTSPPPEEHMDWLNGNCGSKPVRVGNSAYMQVQMDTEGAFVNALYTYISMTGDKVYAIEAWWAIEAIIEWVRKSWKLPSTSIWEERDTLRHFVHTKVMQWVAVDRAHKIALMIGYKDKAEEMLELGEKIKSEVMAKGFSKPLNSFTQYYGSKEVDAALLTLPLYGFIDAKDPKFLSTLRRIERDLVVDNGLVMRYKYDMMGDAAHPFTLTSTWLARVYLLLGDVKKAERSIGTLIQCSTDHELIAEHIDIKTREPRGNFPQLFPHAGLIHAIADLDMVAAGKKG